MNVPIQAKPVLRVTSETVNYEDAVNAAKNKGSCFPLKNCEGSAGIVPKTLEECQEEQKGRGSWRGQQGNQTVCINM